jgi:hypothetical protein
MRTSYGVQQRSFSVHRACGVLVQSVSRRAFTRPRCPRGEGLATPSRHQSGHHLRVLRLQHNSISVNMFGPLLRLPAFFCLSPLLVPHLPG